MNVWPNSYSILRSLLFPVFLLCAGLFWHVPAAVAAEPSKFLALGTGSVNGVFYPVGKGICRMVNEGRLDHGRRCLAYSTGAAVYNIQAIETGELDLGITYANLAQAAYEGTGVFFADAPFRGLRAIASLYQMPAGIIVNRALAVPSIEDLTGLRINVGNIGSGKRTIADSIFSAMSWTTDDFSQITELSTQEVAKAFCDGEVDVIIEAMATPSDFFTRMTNECDGQFISLPAGITNKISADSPGLETMVIPGGIYPYNRKDVQVIGINVVLATSERVHPDAIYTVTKSIFNEYDAYRALHPTLLNGCREDMVKKAKIIPFHSGALRYHEEHNLPCR